MVKPSYSDYEDFSNNSNDALNQATETPLEVAEDQDNPTLRLFQTLERKLEKARRNETPIGHNENETGENSRPPTDLNSTSPQRVRALPKHGTLGLPSPYTPANQQFAL
jgi:hypothetical protein